MDSNDSFIANDMAHTFVKVNGSVFQKDYGTVKGALYGFLQGDTGWPILALLDTGEQPVQAVLRSLNQRTYSDLHFQHTVCLSLAAGKEAVFL